MRPLRRILRSSRLTRRWFVAEIGAALQSTTQVPEALRPSRAYKYSTSPTPAEPSRRALWPSRPRLLTVLTGESPQHPLIAFVGCVLFKLNDYCPQCAALLKRLIACLVGVPLEFGESLTSRLPTWAALMAAGGCFFRYEPSYSASCAAALGFYWRMAHMGQVDFSLTVYGISI